MSFVIQGPYPAMKTTLLLPSPLEGNSKGNTASVQTIRSMNGKVYTYIKSKRARQRHNWEFITSKDKALEAKEFVKEYADGLIRLEDHRGNLRIGYLTINPLEEVGQGRAGGWGKNEEAYRFTIDFEEKV